MHQFVDGAKNGMPKNREEERPLTRSRKSFVALSFVVWTGYLVWRAAFTINWSNAAYSLAFYACELLGYLSFVRFAFITWRMRKRTHRPNRAHPTVDVLIPTYNEDREILRQTIYHCVQMDYPHETYVLDDGRRPEIEALAKEFGAKYLTRPTNNDAKAGNLNHALSSCKGEMIAIFDADGIPRKDFLTRLLGYFDDSEVALVQVPQTFYNIDSFQHINDKARSQIWHEQALFFDIIEPGLDYQELAMCCGSGSILRRSALDQIGGFTTGTVTEDLHTTLKLHFEGFRSVYHHEALAFCLAPASIQEYVTQRARWALGNMQMLRKEWWNILTAKRLNWLQKLVYITPIYYISAYQKLVYYIAPFAYLAFGLTPFETNPWFTTAFVVSTVLSVAAFKVLARGRGHVLLHEVFFLYTLVPYMKSVLKGLIPVDWAFKVTPKKPQSGDGRFPVSLSLSSAAVILLSLSGFIMGLMGISRNHFDIGSVVAAYFTWQHMLIGAIALRNSFKRPRSHESYSFFDYRPMQIKRVNDDRVSDESIALATVISESGLICAHNHSYSLGTKVGIVLSLPDADLILDTIVTQSEPIIRSGQAPFFQIHLKYQNIGQDERLELIRYFFEDATPRVFSLSERASQIGTPVKKSINQRIGERVQSLVPVYVEPLELNSFAPRSLGLLVDISLKGARIKFPGELPLGTRVNVQVPWYNGTIAAKVVRCVQESGQMNPPSDIGFEFESPILLSKEQKDSLKELNTTILALNAA